MISKNLGFSPETRDVQLLRFYEAWKKYIQNDTLTFLDFQGTTVHFFANIITDNIDDIYALLVELFVRQDEYWRASNLIINGALGSSLEGWINRFVGSGLCKGIDIIASDDPRAIKKWTTEDEKLVPGEIVIYFDELQDNEKDPGNELHDAFLQCKNIAEPTKYGGKDEEKNGKQEDTQITLYYSNGQKGIVKYFNLKEKDYTLIDARVTLNYESRGLQYPEKVIKDQIINNFNNRGGINKSIYPSSLICTSTFDGVKTVKVELKKSNKENNTYSISERNPELGERLKLNNITVIQKTS